jgi:2-C-methyl-D-erythritol 4-phosphate cytidylyltransferase
MNIALIFAGGTGSRMNSSVCPKQFLPLYEKPIIIYTIEHFEHHPEIDSIVISCIDSWIPHLEKLLKEFNIKKVKEIVPGGSTGQASIFNGLEAVERHFPEESVVLIHDAVRPILTEKLITDNIASVKKFGNAVTSALPTETPLQIDENHNIDIVYKRDLFRVAKAPQSFKLSDILSVHRQAIEEQYSSAIDSSSLMLKYGATIRLIEGSSSNIKITTPTDYFIFKALVDAHYENQLSDNQKEFTIKY